MRPFAFACSILLATAPTLCAQQADGARLDVSLGGSNVSGGTIDYRSGVLADAFASGGLRATWGGALVAGLGVSGVLGGFGDRCLMMPSGGCAGQGNFAVVTALIGIDRPVGAGSLRVLAGPSYHNGANHASVGPQVRVDVATPAAGHLALGLMTRATILPRHGDAALVVWGLGAGVTLR